MRQNVLCVWTVALCATLLLAWGGRAQGPYASADELLDAIEQAEGELYALSAQIRYDRVYGLVGDEQGRIGTLHYLDSRDGDGEGTRAFAIRFTHLALGRSVRPSEKIYVFDGQWVTEVIPEDKQVFRRQVVAPGETFDPLRIGEGPLPIPIGQAKADILERYDVELVDQADGLEHRDLIRIAARASQMVLTPRPEWAKRDEFREIRLWYGKGANGSLLPLMARTINTQGDEATVRLIGTRLNDRAQIPEDTFVIEIPGEYDIQTTPWREPAPTPATEPAPEPATEPAASPEAQPTGGSRGPMIEPTRVIAHQPERGLIEPDELSSLLLEPSGEETPIERPELAPAVAALLEAEYVSDEDRKDLRIFHGHWTRADLDTPARRALAALIRGDPGDPSLLDENTPALLRARGALARGEQSLAIELLDGLDSLAARRLRAQAHFDAGDLVAADRALDPLVRALSEERVDDAAELVEGVRGLILRSRLRGQQREDGTDYHTLISLLAHARQELDRLYWPATLAEAELLYDKDNRAGAHEAAVDVLRLNPACAEAWAMLAELSTDRLAFEEIDRMVFRLDRLAHEDAPSWSDEGERDLAHVPERSVLGATVLARARLRQDQPGEAANELSPIVERFPGHVRARALLAASHAMAYDLGAADAVLGSFGKNGTGHQTVGWALSERRQYADAAAYLEEAADREPHWARPWIRLGLLETQAGRDGRAIDALERARALDPFNVRADNTLRLLTDLREWETIETEHFVVRFREGIDRVLAEELPVHLEAMHERVTGAARGGMDHEPAQKTTIELMPDHQTFAVRIVGMPALHTIAAATGPVIAMETPRESPKHTRGPYDWLRVLRHEYTHTVTLDRTSYRIPLWFTEAAAQALEDGPKDERTCRLLAEMLLSGGLFELDEINVKFARPVRPFDRQLAYAQGLWMYEYIVEVYGPRAPLELMDAYADGSREVEAFSEVLGVGREVFMEGFLAWATERARGWGLVLPDGVPDVAELSQRDGVLGAPSAEDIVRWLGEHPAHPQVLELAASAIEGVPMENELALLGSWAEAVPVAERPHRLLLRYWLSSDEPDGRSRAIEHLEFLDARESYTPAYAAALAEAYAESGDLPAARAKAERAVLVAPYDAPMRELAARVALAAAAYDDAERHLLALTRLEPDRDRHRQYLERIQEIRAREL